MKNLKFRFEIDDNGEIVSCKPYKGYNETDCREFLQRLMNLGYLGDDEVREIGKVFVIDDSVHYKVKCWDDISDDKPEWLRMENDFTVEHLIRLENRTPKQLEIDAQTGFLGYSLRINE